MGVIAVAAILATAYLLLPMAAWAFVRGLTLTVNGCIWLAASISSGEDTWTIVRTMAGAVATTFVTPQVSGLIIALVVVGAVAIFGLQRLLGSEEESRQ